MGKEEELVDKVVEVGKDASLKVKEKIENIDYKGLAEQGKKKVKEYTGKDVNQILDTTQDGVSSTYKSIKSKYPEATEKANDAYKQDQYLTSEYSQKYMDQLKETSPELYEKVNKLFEDAKQTTGKYAKEGKKQWDKHSPELYDKANKTYDEVKEKGPKFIEESRKNASKIFDDAQKSFDELLEKEPEIKEKVNKAWEKARKNYEDSFGSDDKKFKKDKKKRKKCEDDEKIKGTLSSKGDLVTKVKDEHLRELLENRFGKDNDNIKSLFEGKNK